LNDRFNVPRLTGQGKSVSVLKHAKIFEHHRRIL